MATTGADPTFVDTNILVYSSVKEAPRIARDLYRILAALPPSEVRALKCEEFGSIGSTRSVSLTALPPSVR